MRAQNGNGKSRASGKGNAWKEAGKKDKHCKMGKSRKKTEQSGKKTAQNSQMMRSEKDRKAVPAAPDSFAPAAVSSFPASPILHTFAICAYGNSPYLEECMASLACQGCGSEVICCTSTPSPYIYRLAGKYGIPVYVREGKSNIRQDWLFAFEKAAGELVTIAHQDDRYGKDYGKTLLAMYRKYPDMTVFCSDYATIRMEAGKGKGRASGTGQTGKEASGTGKAGKEPAGTGQAGKEPEGKEPVGKELAGKELEGTGRTEGEAVGRGPQPEKGGGLEPKLQLVNTVWLVKKLLRLPLRLRPFADRTAVKRAALLFGNSVCCPSCTYNKKLIEGPIFDSPFEFALDWDNLYELAGRPGRFVCCERQLMFYRVHPGATTKQCIEDNRRKNDEIAMFRKMWPEPFVKLLMHFYKKAYGAYEK